MVGRFELMVEAAAMVEKELTIVGASAIEDKLQVDLCCCCICGVLCRLNVFLFRAEQAVDFAISGRIICSFLSSIHFLSFLHSFPFFSPFLSFLSSISFLHSFPPFLSRCLVALLSGLISLSGGGARDTRRPRQRWHQNLGPHR